MSEPEATEKTRTNEGVQNKVFPVGEIPKVLEAAAKQLRLPSQGTIGERFRRFASALRPDLHVLVEYPYVDAIYRDSYYRHFSSHHRAYKRDCLRLCFFGIKVQGDWFLQGERAEALQENFLGCMVIRPTDKPIGRNMISPRAFSDSSFVCSLTRSEILVGGTKLNVHAFPHSSQDSTTHTCAETTVWSVMEYFSSRYPDYAKVLTSEISTVLADASFSRLVPSDGLTIFQISRALMKFGFGTKVYSNAEPDFRRKFHYYIESGIPVIGGIKNDKIGHAVVYIGHKEFDLPATLPAPSETVGGVEIVDTADLNVKYVTVDDNLVPYAQSDFADPSAGRTHEDWAGVKITSFVVPLYHRIYLEAKTARNLLHEILDSPVYGLNRSGFERRVLLRFFLTSARSFKFRLTKKPTMEERLRRTIVASRMPKFIWVAELSTEDQYRAGKVGGLVIIDATGKDSRESVLALIYPERVFEMSSVNPPEPKKVLVPEFDQYQNNLKGGWCEWIS